MNLEQVLEQIVALRKECFVIEVVGLDSVTSQILLKNLQEKTEIPVGVYTADELRGFLPPCPKIEDVVALPALYRNSFRPYDLLGFVAFDELFCYPVLTGEIVRLALCEKDRCLVVFQSGDEEFQFPQWCFKKRINING